MRSSDCHPPTIPAGGMRDYRSWWHHCRNSRFGNQGSGNRSFFQAACLNCCCQEADSNQGKRPTYALAQLHRVSFLISFSCQGTRARTSLLYSGFAPLQLYYHTLIKKASTTRYLPPFHNLDKKTPRSPKTEGGYESKPAEVCAREHGA